LKVAHKFISQADEIFKKLSLDSGRPAVGGGFVELHGQANVINNEAFHDD